MERCPCCNARLRDPKQCQRCHSDFSIAVRAAETAAYFLTEGIKSWQAGFIDQSLLCLHQALRFKHHPVGDKLFNRLLQDYCQQILVLLEQNQLLNAKQALYKVRPLLSEYHLLNTLNEWVDFKWVHSGN